VHISDCVVISCSSECCVEVFNKPIQSISRLIVTHPYTWQYAVRGMRNAYKMSENLKGLRSPRRRRWKSYFEIDLEYGLDSSGLGRDSVVGYCEAPRVTWKAERLSSSTRPCSMDFVFGRSSCCPRKWLDAVFVFPMEKTLNSVSRYSLVEHICYLCNELLMAVVYEFSTACAE
jgi:hypothetical protein